MIEDLYVISSFLNLICFEGNRDKEINFLPLQFSRLVGIILEKESYRESVINR